MSVAQYRVRLEIDLDKLKKNFSAVASRVAPGKVIAVLKANAYGLGVRPLAEVLAKEGCAGFGVAEINEALELIDLGLPVRILGNLLPDEVIHAVGNDVIVPVCDYESGQRISLAAQELGKTAKVQILVDTGMGRLGLIEDVLTAEIERIISLPNLEVFGILCHCPVAYHKFDSFTNTQLERFVKSVEALQQKGLRFEEIHMAASDAINNFPQSVQPPFNRARAGINLYGYCDNEVAHTMELEGVVSLKTQIAQIRTLPAGTTLGYGRTYRLSKESKVATIAAGYADGLPLALSNRGYVLIHGQLCPILGKVSMDYTTVLVDSVPEAKCGDEVVCLGEQGENSILLEEWIQLKGTNAYELLCSIGTRVKRVYISK